MQIKRETDRLRLTKSKTWAVIELASIMMLFSGLAWFAGAVGADFLLKSGIGLWAVTLPALVGLLVVGGPLVIEKLRVVLAGEIITFDHGADQCLRNGRPLFSISRIVRVDFHTPRKGSVACFVHSAFLVLKDGKRFHLDTSMNCEELLTIAKEVASFTGVDVRVREEIPGP